MPATYLIIIHDTGPGIKLATFGLVDEFSTKEGNLLLTHAQPLSYLSKIIIIVFQDTSISSHMDLALLLRLRPMNILGKKD